MARHCTMPDGPQASFKSSNQGLDAVWDLCERSALYTTHEQFVDTPTREKGQFLWDACNESQVIMRVHAESNLSFQALRDFARSQKRFWPDGRVSDIYPTGYGAQSYVNFTALYPEWVWRYFLSTGDTATLESLYPTLERLADYLWRPVRPQTGLVTGVPLAQGGDNNYGYDFATECDASINILSANAFARIGLIAAVLGDVRGAATQRSRSTTVSGAVNRYLVGADGLYVDGLRADGSRSPHTSQLANIQALAYGLVPARAQDGGGPLRGEPGYLGGARLRDGATAFPSRCGAGLRCRRDVDQCEPARLGLDTRPRRDLHLGGMGVERPHRRQHVPRMGIVSPGRHARGTARGVAGCSDERSAPNGSRDLPGILGAGRLLGCGTDHVGNGLGHLGAVDAASMWPCRFPLTPRRRSGYRPTSPSSLKVSSVPIEHVKESRSPGRKTVWSPSGGCRKLRDRRVWLMTCLLVRRCRPRQDESSRTTFAPASE